MGLCGSSLSAEEKAEIARNKKLELEARQQRDAEANKLKFLLLGAGESGKSTLFKQMKILFSEQHGFTKSELQSAIKVVYSNILGNMKILLTNCETHTPAEDAALADEILALDDGVAIDAELGSKLVAIWEDPGVQATWKQRADFQVQDALAYYMDAMDRVQEDGYVPTNQDILRSRVRTSGIVEAEYTVDGVRIAMFDVGGQRNERKKWIHAFDNVTAVIFVAAISEYDQKLYEDQSVSRQDESVALFKEMCGSTWFRNKSMILFLNKADLFREKLQEVPFKIESGPNARNVDYNGPEAVPGTPSARDGTPEFEAVYEASSKYLTDLYKKAGKASNASREIYTKVTSATDTDQVKVVMESAKDIVLRSNLENNGFM